MSARRDQLGSVLVALLLLSSLVAGPVASVALAEEVSFSGTLVLRGEPATNGTSYTYDVRDADAIHDFAINLTGRTGTEWDNDTRVGMVDGESISLSAGGDLAPGGPSGVPEVTVTGHQVTRSKSEFKNQISSGGYSFADAPGMIQSVSWSVENYCPTCGNTDYDVYLDTNGKSYLLYSGTVSSDQTASNTSVNVDTDGQATIRFEAPNELSLYSTTIKSGTPTNISLAADDGTTTSVGSLADGASQTTTLNLSTSATALTPSFDGGGAVDLAVKLLDRQQTQAVTVEINGETTTYHGTLAAGETTTLSPDTAWVHKGTNRVNITVAPGLSSDAPTGVVDIDYSHRAVANQTISATAEAWTERYNVSRQYGDATDKTSVTLPFSETVVAIRDVDKRVNSDTWHQVADEDIHLDGTTLSVDVGDVPTNATVEVRANGSKVNTENGSLRVFEPTVPGDDLATQFKITDVTGTFGIDVSGTDPAARVHYVTNASYTPAGDYARITNGGAKQTLVLPNASAGATATARTLPLAVTPVNDARVSVVDPDEPRFRLSPGRVQGDSVRLRYFAAKDGTTAKLHDMTNDKIAATATASSSAVTFDLNRDETGVYRILAEESTDAGSGGGGGGGVGRSVRDAVRDIGPLVNPVVMIIAAAAVILVGAWVASETKLSFRIVGVVAVLVSVGVLETLRPGTITVPIERVLSTVEAVGPALWLAGGGIGLWALYRIVKKVTRRESVVISAVRRR